MNNRPNVTISIGAGRDEVTVDGVVFDRSKMTGPEKGKLSRMLCHGLIRAKVLKGPFKPWRMKNKMKRRRKRRGKRGRR